MATTQSTAPITDKPAAKPADVENKDNDAHRTDAIKTDVTADGMRIETNWDQVVTSFDEMNLKDELLRGIYAYVCI